MKLVKKLIEIDRNQLKLPVKRKSDECRNQSNWSNRSIDGVFWLWSIDKSNNRLLTIEHLLWNGGGRWRRRWRRKPPTKVLCTQVRARWFVYERNRIDGRRKMRRRTSGVLSWTLIGRPADGCSIQWTIRVSAKWRLIDASQTMARKWPLFDLRTHACTDRLAHASTKCVLEKSSVRKATVPGQLCVVRIPEWIEKERWATFCLNTHRRRRRLNRWFQSIWPDTLCGNRRRPVDCWVKKFPVSSFIWPYSSGCKMLRNLATGFGTTFSFQSFSFQRFCFCCSVKFGLKVTRFRQLINQTDRRQSDSFLVHRWTACQVDQGFCSFFHPHAHHFPSCSSVFGGWPTSTVHFTNFVDRPVDFLSIHRLWNQIHTRVAPI